MIGHWLGMSRSFVDLLRDPSLRRVHRKVRISVTDRCSFKCRYCVPTDEVPLLARDEILSHEEIERFTAACAVPLGLTRLRLTGGDPLVRRGLPSLVARLKAVPGVERLGLTTNADRLAPVADELAGAGLDAVNISLDTLSRQRFWSLARVDRLDAVLAGIEAAAAAGFASLKLNCVLIRGVNDDEIGELAAFGIERGFEVRFIELMPFGNAWGRDRVVSSEEVLAAIAERLGPYVADDVVRGETARTYGLRRGGRFGLISSVTEPFCSHCERLRLSANGRLLTCLFARDGVDLRALLREGAGPEELQGAVREALRSKGVGPMDGSERHPPRGEAACPNKAFPEGNAPRRGASLRSSRPASMKVVGG